MRGVIFSGLLLAAMGCCRAGVSNTTLSGPANGWTADCLQRARRMHRRSNAIHGKA